MSFSAFQSWQLVERERRTALRSFTENLKRFPKSEYSRVYLFDFPVFHKISRMDRERQLFNATMSEHVKHEHRQSPWVKGGIAAGVLFVAAMILLIFPPDFLKESKALIKARATMKQVTDRWVDGFKVQNKIPEKVWVNGAEPLRRLARNLGLKSSAGGAEKISEATRQAEIPAQIAEIRTRTRHSDAEAEASKGDAVTLVVRGDVKMQTANGLVKLMPRDLVPEGSKVISGPRSFAKFLLFDKSVFSVGPDTSLNLALNKTGDVSVMNLISGSMRAKVTKSPEKDEAGKPREKMVIHTSTAAMGIRGTDFLITYADQQSNTSLVTFEGIVAMAKMNKPEEAEAFSVLQTPAAVAVPAGTLGEARKELPSIAPPILIPAAQMETMKAANDVQGPLEAGMETYSLAFAHEALANAIYVRTNKHAAQYEETTEEKLAEALKAGSGRTPASLSPRKEDYEVSSVPDRYKNEKREFPDQ